MSAVVLRRAAVEIRPKADPEAAPTAVVTADREDRLGATPRDSKALAGQAAPRASPIYQHTAADRTAAVAQGGEAR
jgi:hypothetical protein